MSEDFERAHELDDYLETASVAAASGDPELAAMSALAGDLASALGGAWLSAGDRARLWTKASRPAISMVRRERPVWRRKRTMVAGGAVLTLGAAAVSVALVQRRRQSHGLDF